jgi:CelD/BcsL family acetyltransferase involved in cellulose biosynthesis
MPIQHGGAELIGELAGGWSRLCGDASNDEPFYRPEWVNTYARSFARDKLTILTCRHADRLSGLLPLVRDRATIRGLPARRLRSAANVHCCRSDLVRLRGPAGDAAIQAIWDELKRLRDWDVIQLLDVPGDGALMHLVELAARDGHPVDRWLSKHTPVVPLAPTGSMEPWLAQTSGRFRSNLRRAERRLAQSGPLELTRIERPDGLSLDAFYQLERAGWKGAAGSAISCDPFTKSFYDEIAHSGLVHLYSLRCGTRPVGICYAVEYGDRLFTLKMGVEEEFAACSPGQLTLQAVLRDCVERRITLCDFVGPMTEWQARWTSQTRPHYWLWIFRKSAYGRLLHAAKFTAADKMKTITARLKGART